MAKAAAVVARAPASGAIPAWMKHATSQIGVVEGAGAKNNPTVVGYYAESGNAGIKSDDVAWCAAFVGAMLKRAGIKGSGSLAARSYETWGEPVPKAAPLYGCIGVKKRVGGAAWQGHVGYVVAANATHVWLLGGNQNDAVNIARFPRADFTAFRWPPGVPRTGLPALPTSAQGAAAVREA